MIIFKNIVPLYICVGAYFQIILIIMMMQNPKSTRSAAIITQIKQDYDVVFTLNTHDSSAVFPAVSLTLKSTAMSPSGNPDAG